MLGHGAFGYHHPLSDGGVGPALGHQGQHLAFARAEGGQAAVTGVAGEKAGDHLRVHRGAAGGDPADGVHELGAVEYPVLEQVADAPAATGQQFAGVQLLDVLGEHEHRQAGHLTPGGQRGPDAFVGERGRQPAVHDGHVRGLCGDGGQQVGAVVDGGGRRCT